MSKFKRFKLSEAQVKSLHWRKTGYVARHKECKETNVRRVASLIRIKRPLCLGPNFQRDDN